MSRFRQKFQATTNRVKPDAEGLAEAPRKPRRAARRRSAPVTAHRLFPAFAAAWFAALLGLGSLAIPGPLLGALVLKTGLPALVPAAAPPLGFTAHLLVAVALAMLGAAIGLAISLRLRPQGLAEARPVAPIVTAPAPAAEEVYKVRARDAHPDAPPRRPLVLTEALADPIFEPAAEPLTEEPVEPEAPLLRRKRSVEGSEPVAPWIQQFVPGGNGVVRPLDLSALDLDDAAEPPFFAQPEPVITEAVEPLAQQQPEPEPVAEPAAAPAAPVLIAATPQLPVGFTAALSDAADGKWSPVAGAPLENLGLVQLVERLALAIAEQKAANEAVIAADAAAGNEAEERQLNPGPFSRPQIVSPAEPASDEHSAGSTRNAILRRLGAIAEESPAAAPNEAVVPIRPVEQGAPALSLAATAPMAPVEANEALRTALATLQRMTARA